MRKRQVNREILEDFLTRLDASVTHPASVYLIGETTQVWEGWREWTRDIEFTAEPGGGREAFADAWARIADELAVTAYDESPADVIPLPAAPGERARRASPRVAFQQLTLWHFDPYSVVLRFIARGDEQDYHVGLTFMEHGWVRSDELDAKLGEVLARCTARTIRQDPAELRRKYKGLLQMWKAVTPGTTHRATPA